METLASWLGRILMKWPGCSQVIRMQHVFLLQIMGVDMFVDYLVVLVHGVLGGGLAGQELGNKGVERAEPWKSWTHSTSLVFC
jgi:hypothetical protein